MIGYLRTICNGSFKYIIRYVSILKLLHYFIIEHVHFIFRENQCPAYFQHCLHRRKLKAILLSLNWLRHLLKSVQLTGESSIFFILMDGGLIAGNAHICIDARSDRWREYIVDNYVCYLFYRSVQEVG